LREKNLQVTVYKHKIHPIAETSKTEAAFYWKSEGDKLQCWNRLGFSKLWGVRQGTKAGAGQRF